MIQSPSLTSDATLDLLANHCIAARTMIDEVGTPVMRRLIDLLLFEIGVALSAPAEFQPVLEPAE